MPHIDDRPDFPVQKCPASQRTVQHCNAFLLLETGIQTAGTLTPNGSPFDTKLIEKVLLQSKFGLIYQDSERISLCV